MLKDLLILKALMLLHLSLFIKLKPLWFFLFLYI